MEVGVKRHAPVALPPGNIPDAHYTGCWMGPRAGLDGCVKQAPIRIRFPDRPGLS
jgi:hypothetical protein